MNLKEGTSIDLPRRARDARTAAEAADLPWMKELLEHIAAEYERAAERLAQLLEEDGAGMPAAVAIETSLFGI